MYRVSFYGEAGKEALGRLFLFVVGVVCCWGLSGSFRGSTRKPFSEDLSGILGLGFQQNSIFQEFVGHIALGLPTGFKFQES